MGIFDKISGTIKDFVKGPEDFDDNGNGYIDDEFTDKDAVDEFPDAPKYENYSYSPAGSVDMPEYTSYDEVKKEVNSKSHSTGAKIHNINNAPRYTPKFSMCYLTLNDMYDAKNVADRIMDKDTIVIVNLANLGETQRIRAMDFLDGTKYVAKCIFAQLTDEIFAYIPKDVELHGDFLEQVEI